MKHKEEHLQQIIETLETDIKDGLPMSAIRVDDISTPGSVFNILCNSTNEDLINNYGSAKGFFESLSKSNIKTISIIPLKRNGKQNGNITWKRATKVLPLEFSFTSTEVEKPILKEEKSNAPVLNNIPVSMHGVGLSGSDMHKIYDHQRLQTENSELKAKNELLERENKRLEKEVLTSELIGQKSVEKAQAQAELVKAGQGYLPVVLEVIKNLKPQPTSMQGLTGTLSPVKERFLKADDDLLLELEQIGMRCDNQNFIDELKVLIDKYPNQNGH